MTFLCLECGHINEDNPELICRPCQTPLNKELYELLVNYSNLAVTYGYDYRIQYEKQVKEHGKIIAKYSLVSPTNYYEWLAAAALSGLVGSMAYDLVKYVAKQIYATLNEKRKTIELEHKENEIFEIVADPAVLNKFVTYIQSYYNGSANIDKKAEAGVLEEELVHSLTENYPDEILKALEISNEGGKEALEKQFGVALIEAAKLASKKRGQRPSYKQLDNLLPILKKQIKADKKAKKKAKKRR